MGRFAATFVKIPLLVATVPITAITAATQDPGAVQAKRLPNSIDTLSPHNRFVLEVNKLPITPGIPYHSIIGDRGHGDTPNSSDGVVAYWSSHLDGAQSELIVPSNHSSPANIEAIALDAQFTLEIVLALSKHCHIRIRLLESSSKSGVL